MEKNPDIKFTKSKGIDLPILYVYLAGRIAGNVIDKCLKWRRDIINHYHNYKYNDVQGCYESYPIAFLDPLNSGEADSVDGQGLTSNIPSNLIFDKDLLSVERADIIVANLEDYFEEDLTKITDALDILDTVKIYEQIQDYNRKDLENKFVILIQAVRFLYNKILTRRENIGTLMEVAWAFYLKKPVVLIVPERRKEIFQKHPFTKRASVIVTSTEQLLKEKWLNILYKSIAGAV